MAKFFITFLIFPFLAVGSVWAITPAELQIAIEDKNNELANIRNQIQETQGKLEELTSQSRSLGKEIQKLDYTINQLNLGIRLSEVNIEKLELELESLKDKKIDTERNIDLTKVAMGASLRELQRKGDENLLQVLLKNSSLAEGVLEIQSLKDLQESLVLNSAQLENLNVELGENIEEAKITKAELEVENRNLKARKALAAEEKQEKNSLLKQTKNQESLYQKQLKDLEEQQDLIDAQITAIEDELRLQLGPGFIPPRITGAFAWPVILGKDGGVGRISQRFGQKSYLYRGRPHNGLDVAAPTGTLVYAAQDGRVARVDNNDRSSWRKYQYGKYILVEHGNNLSTLYAHLSKQLVREGDLVKRGGIIGYIGRTGYATGSHLHFGLYLTTSLTFRAIGAVAGLVPIGVSLNPENYL